MASAPQTTVGSTGFRVTGNRAADQPATASGSSVCAHCTDGLGKPREVKPGSFREKVHSNAAVAITWRVAVFTAVCCW